MYVHNNSAVEQGRNLRIEKREGIHGICKEIVCIAARGAVGVSVNTMMVAFALAAISTAR